MGTDGSATSRQSTLLPVEHGEESTGNKDKLSPDDWVEKREGIITAIPQQGFFFLILLGLCVCPRYGFVLIMWMQGTSDPASLLSLPGEMALDVQEQEEGAQDMPHAENPLISPSLAMS